MTPARHGVGRGLCLAALAALAACASTPAPVDEAPPPLTPVEQTAALLDAAAESPWFEVRYNPCPCPCPPFEVLLGNQWLRTLIRPSDDEPPTRELIAAATDDLAAGRAPRYAVIGSIDDSVRRCATNALVVRLDATGWSRQIPPPLPEPETLDAAP